MAIYGTLEVVLKPPTERSQGVKSPRMALKRVFPLLATSFEINILSITVLPPRVCKKAKFSVVYFIFLSVQCSGSTAPIVEVTCTI